MGDGSMNQLSWLLYAAEVSERAQSVFGFLAFMTGFMGFIGIVVMWGYYAAILADLPKQTIEKGWRVWLTVAWAFVTCFLIVASLAFPSQRTIYMIAASEAGETVVTSPDAKEMLGDLKAIIRKKLKEELGEVAL